MLQIYSGYTDITESQRQEITKTTHMHYHYTKNEYYLLSFETGATSNSSFCFTILTTHFELFSLNFSEMLF